MAGPLKTPHQDAWPVHQANTMRRVGLGVVVLICVLLLVALLPQFNRASQPKYTGPVESVKTGLIGEYAALVLIAEDQGYFKEYGLNVTISEYASGPEALADLVAGKVDTAMGSDFAGVRNSFDGQDLRILGTLSKSEAFFMVVRKDRGIDAAGDLKGKKIGLTAKTVGEFYLGQYLTFSALTTNQIRVVEKSQAELVDAVTAGEVDAAVLFEPNAYKALSKLKDKAESWSVQSGQSIYSLLYGTDAFVRERPKVIERYMRAVVAAENFMKAEDTKAREIIARRLGYDKAYVDYIWPKFTFEASLEQELLLNMDDEARWVLENGLALAAKPPNFLRLLYLDALSAAKPQGVTVIR